MADSLFNMEGLSFGYGPTPVLKDLTLTLPGGCFIGLAGPNGSGKTTLVDLLIGARQPDRGRIEFMGRPLSQWPRARLARAMALAPQEFAADFPFSVAETVMMGRHPYIPRFAAPGAEDRRQVERALGAVGMEHLAEKPVNRLSGGEKQRAILARTLAQDTQVLLLDEPTSNLDINHALSILGLLERLVRQEGKTVLAVLHDLNLAAAFCQYLVFLQEGRVFAKGLTGQVMTAENLKALFGVTAQVGPDPFSHSLAVRFQKEAPQW